MARSTNQMGAWGTGSFENDDASEWISELEDSDGWKILKTTLRAVLDAGDGYLEADVAARGVAAAEVVAGLNDSPGDDLPEEVEGWVEDQRSRKERDLAPLALEALARIATNSELSDLWNQSADGARWKAALGDLEARLKGEGS